jgi:glycosyltransferase involved in cell wall biosynthesis
MKIIHYIASIDKQGGGTTAYLQLLAKELKSYAQIVIATGYSPNPVKIEGTKVVFFNKSLKNWFKLKKEFSAFLKMEQPNLVHINGIWNPDTALFQQCAQQLNIKIVLSPHGMLEPYILNRNPYKKKIALKLYQHKAIKSADYIHATAQSELNNISNLGYKQSSFVIPNGIDLSNLKTKTDYSASNTFKILFLSRIHQKKGIEYLIEAISRIQTTKKIVVNIAGTGDQEYIHQLTGKINQHKLNHIIKFVGAVYGLEKWNLFAESDLFVLPTYSENFGIAVAEALATGIPVITTKGTPWQELDTLQCGWWIDLNIENLTKSIQTAIATSPEVLKKMGQRGKELIKNNYDINIIARQFKTMYNKILATN